MNTSDATCSSTCPADCYNGGVRGASACDCSCPPGYTGPQCQYTANPCAATDSTDCANVNKLKLFSFLFLSTFIKTSLHINRLTVIQLLMQTFSNAKQNVYAAVIRYVTTVVS